MNPEGLPKVQEQISELQTPEDNFTNIEKTLQEKFKGDEDIMKNNPNLIKKLSTTFRNLEIFGEENICNYINDGLSTKRGFCFNLN